MNPHNPTPTQPPLTGPTPATAGPGPAAVDPRPARPGLGWTEIAVATVAYFALSFAAGFALYAMSGGAEPATVPFYAVFAIATLAAVAVTVAVRVRSLAAVGLRRTTVRWLLIGFGAGVGVWLLNRFVVLGYILITGDGSNPQADLAATAAGPALGLAGILLVGAVLTPIAEELLFRGVLFGALRRHGMLLATLVSAVVFGLAHGITAVLFGAVVLGNVAAVLYERSRSIWPAVMVHAVNNAIIFTTAAILL